MLSKFKQLVIRHIDKVAHFAITYGVVYTLADKWDVNGAIAVGILLGVAKEIWDKLRYGKLSVADLIADILGIVVACTVLGV